MAPTTDNGPTIAQSPLAQRRVQWTLTGIALVALLAMLPSALSSRPAQRPGADGLPVQRLRIDVNTAEARELALLPGVGPVLARRIVADRQQQGRFNSVAELDRVHGIGPKTIARLAEDCEVVASSP